MLYFRAAQHNINICVIHIRGVQNNVADAIFRFQMVRFWQLVLMAYPTAHPIPAWPMESFTNASCNADIMTLPPQPGEPTSQESSASNASVTSMASSHCQLRHFCASESHQVSYKTLKVYLSDFST